jgi:FKBP-type peptidyl-prolyl cis-trans isomerase SlyD
MSDIVTKHKVVSFTHNILNENGEVLERSDIPTDYVHGSDEHIFPAVMAEALEGAAVGDTKEISLPPEIGYGAYDENKTYRGKIEDMPPEYSQLGARATFKDEDGKELMMTVMSVENGEVFLDGNHPFAGKTLTVSMTIKAIRDATVEEIGTGLSKKYQQNQSKNNNLH